MRKTWRSLAVGGLVGVPILVWIAWLATGREHFTASGKAIEVSVRDELFGDTVTQTRMVPGPLCGYYIGLDLAIAVTLVALVAAAILWWHSRHRRGRQLRDEMRTAP